MANLSFTCPQCNKKVEFVKETIIEVLQKRLVTYTCGHVIDTPLIKSETEHIDKIVSTQGHRPFKYQSETVRFIEQADLRGIVNHEMGVGKTVIANLIIELHKQELAPVLIISPAGLLHQWRNHCFAWNRDMAQILTTKDPYPDFDFHSIFIVSVDTLHRLPWMAMVNLQKSKEIRAQIYRKTGQHASFQEIEEKIDKPEYREIRNKFNFICVDEVQKISNPSAQRTQAVKKIGAGKKVLTLSGTPIKNNAAEYFTALNLVRPDIFKTEAGYIKQFCRIGSYGKIYGMQNIEKFKSLTQDWIIRYERKDVLPDLPLIFRQFRSAEMENKDLQQAYENELDGFLDFMDDHSDKGIGANEMTNILAYFARMRHITGLSKVDPTVEYVEQFLLETDRKITIFVHHKDVMERLLMKLNHTLKIAGYNECQTITSDKDSKERMEVIEEFRKPQNRILVASTLAAGEGINLQFCSDCIIMERQWNPANEEQAEARFPRPGSIADKINAIYMIVPGTIDDMLTELVEKKRSYMKETLNYEQSNWQESALMKDLMDVLQTKGKAKWKASLL